jgi:hypothetical protein
MSSDFFKIKKGLNIQPTDPSGLSNLKDGDIVIDSTAGNSMKVYSTDAGGFQEVGTGSGINYIDNNSFDGGVSGWTGDTNLVISKEDVSPLRGVGSLKIAKAAADASGEQVYTDFSVETADLSKKLTISFDYDASDANYSDGDMRILVIKDPAGTPVTIRVNGEDLKGGKGTHIAQFQTDATITDYRLVIEQVSTQASAVNILIDNVSVGPREIVKGAAMTDWKEYTPNGSWTNTTYYGKWRRIGDSAEVQISAVMTGVPAGSIINVELPSGLEIDINKLSVSGAAKSLGTVGMLNNGTDWGGGFVAYNGTNSVTANIKTSTATYQYSRVTPTSPFTFANGDQVNFEFTVPIKGWSSNAITSEDLGGREVYFRGEGSVNSVVTSNTRIQYITESSAGVVNNAGLLTIQETGDYFINASVGYTGAVDGIIRALVNGNPISEGRMGSSTGVAQTSKVVRLFKGDTLEFRILDSDSSNIDILNNTTYRTNASVQKLASPQTILETETVAARYTSNNGQTLTNGAIVKYEDLTKDTHNAYNISTGEYTVPVSGWYQVNATGRPNTNTSLVLIARIDSVDTQVGACVNSSDSSSAVVSALLYVEKGQVIDIMHASGATRSLDTTTSSNTFSIHRVK